VPAGSETKKNLHADLPERFRRLPRFASAASAAADGEFVTGVILEMLFTHNGPAVLATEDHQTPDIRAVQAKGFLRIMHPIVGFRAAVQALHFGVHWILEVPVSEQLLPFRYGFGTFAGLIRFEHGLNAGFKTFAVAQPEIRAEHHGVQIAVFIKKLEKMFGMCHTASGHKRSSGGDR
jgi:hypothetical protein